MKPSVLLSRLAVVFVAGITTVCSQTLQLEPVERLPTPVVDPASDDAQLAIKRFSLPQGTQGIAVGRRAHARQPGGHRLRREGTAVRLGDLSLPHQRARHPRLHGHARARPGLAHHRRPRRPASARCSARQAKQFAIESEVVRLVEDTNHDGVADKSSIYADGFNSELDGIASGVLARHGKVWFTNIPSLWLLEGDAGNVKKTELLRGFGVRFNFTGHDFHGLALGNDGKIYFSIGDRGMNVKQQGRQASSPIPTRARCSARTRTAPSSRSCIAACAIRRSWCSTNTAICSPATTTATRATRSAWCTWSKAATAAGASATSMRRSASGGPWLREGLWKPRFAGRPAYLLPPICNIEDGPSGTHLLPGHRPHARVRRSFLHHAFQGQHRAQRHPDLHAQAERRDASCPPAASSSSAACCPPTSPSGRTACCISPTGWMAGPSRNKGRIYGITPVNPDPAQVKVERRSRQTAGRRIHEAIDQANWSRCCRIRIGARASRRSSSWPRAATPAVSTFAKVADAASPPIRWRDCTRSGA